jgi:hypothetical protein
MRADPEAAALEKLRNDALHAAGQELGLDSLPAPPSELVARLHEQQAPRPPICRISGTQNSTHSEKVGGQINAGMWSTASSPNTRTCSQSGGNVRGRTGVQIGSLHVHAGSSGGTSSGKLSKKRMQANWEALG